MYKSHDSVDNLGRTKITCEVVLKESGYVDDDKNAKKEYYIRRSIQDYFIKFSESSLSEIDIAKMLERKKDDFIKMLTLTVVFKDGYWDDTKEDQTEDRKGAYVILVK